MTDARRKMVVEAWAAALQHVPPKLAAERYTSYHEPDWHAIAAKALALHDAETRVLRTVLGRILDRLESNEAVGFSVDDYEMVRAVVRDAPGPEIWLCQAPDSCACPGCRARTGGGDDQA